MTIKFSPTARLRYFTVKPFCTEARFLSALSAVVACLRSLFPSNRELRNRLFPTFFPRTDVAFQRQPKQQRTLESCDQKPPRRLEPRSEEHTSELQSRLHLVCRLLL